MFRKEQKGVAWHAFPCARVLGCRLAAQSHKRGGMWKSGWARVAVVAASLCSSVALASPAEAYTWPGESANHTAVLAAMVIGQSCRGSLSRQERVEIRTYLTAKRREHDKQQADAKSREVNPFQQDQLDGLAQALSVMLTPDEVQKTVAYYGRLAAEQQAAKDKTGTYPAISWATMQRGVAGAFNRKFRRARSCDAGTLEFARDMAKRVRTAVAAEAWLALLGRPLGKHGRFGDAIVGRVIGRKCPGVLSAEEAGELQTYIERTLAEFARTAKRADGVAERAFLAKAEARYERGFAGCDGFPPIQARKALEQIRTQ
jgi:hypothetical protein